MKAFVCVVLLAAAALAAPEGKRDKRGYLLGGYDHFDSYDHGLTLNYGHGHFDHGHFDHGYDAHFYDHAPIIHHHHAPAAKIVSVNKVVEVPKVVEVKKVVSIPKVVSVPQVVKYSKIIAEPHYSYASSGWW